MFSYLWPITLVVVANVMYQICTKSVPADMDPVASIIVTYLVGAVASTVLFFLLNRGGSLRAEFVKLNWAPATLGLVIVALEVGFIYAYKAGWAISTASLVQSAFVTVVLLLIGTLVYHEALTLNKVVGIAVCLFGLFLISR